MAKYYAQRTCFYKDKLYKAGETLVYDGASVPCPACKGKGCRQCGGSCRSNPPHHFQLAKKEEAQAEKAEENEKDIKALRAELESIGASYDRRWPLNRLKNELIKAKKERGL